MRKLFYILSILISGTLFSQFVDVTNIQRTGNFAACGGAAPTITAQITTSTGSTVQNGALVITDPCGYTTLRVTMAGLRYNQPSANWPHGFFFPANANITVSNVGLPAGWIQMNSVTGASCSAQETGGVGFYYDGSTGSSCTECWPTMNDGNPSNNYGQSSMSCSTAFTIMFDMTFCNSQVETTQTQFTLTGKSDGNTGCWSSPDYQNNTVTFTISTVATDEPVFSETPESPQVITECTNGTNLNYIAEFTGDCGNGSEITWWSAPVGGAQIGTGSPFYFDPPGAACPQGLIFYAQCCPVGTQCDNRVPVVVGPCSPPSSEPIFAPIPPQCPGGDNPLPSTSIDGSTGSWSPAFDPYNTATYTFTPNPGQCATLPVDVEVEILPAVTISFAPVQPICQNSTPPDLPDPNPAVPGNWSPAVIDTSATGTFEFTFTPTDACSEPVTIDITIIPEIIPQFAIINNHYCSGDTLIDLPPTSDNGYNGTWAPAQIDTSVIGTTTYTFTPSEDGCVETFSIDIEVEEMIIPTFDAVAPLCQNSTAPALPVNHEGLSGNWSPATIDTSTAGTFEYTFTPDRECSEPVTIEVTVEEFKDPQFLLTNHYCSGTDVIDLPTTSDNGFEGSWTPAAIDTSVIGTTTYTFIPSDSNCYDAFSIDIEVEEMIIPTFDAVAPLCQNSTAPALPVNHEGLSGNWSPATIDTSTAGTFEYTFTPDRECSEPVTIEVTVEEFKDPQFLLTNHYCSGTDVIDLPTTSDNGFEGSWSPAAIDTSVIGTTTYTFIPSDSNCYDAFSIDIQVEEMIIPTFDAVDAICQGSVAPALPVNHEGLSGNWSPAVISTDTAGTFEFTFTPDRECSEPVTIEVTVNPEVIAEFDLQLSYCQGETPEALSGTSANGVHGSWFPATIDTSATGISTYTFTPNDGQCSYELPVNIEVYEKPVLNSVAPIVLCDDNFDGIYPVNLVGLNPSLGGGNDITFTYYASQNDLNNNNPIPNNQWSNYQINSLPKTIYITGSSVHGCISEAVAVTYTKGETVDHNNGPFTIEFCEGENIDLTSLESQISGIVGVDFGYFNSQSNAQNNSGEIMNPENFHPAVTQNAVYIRLESDDNCPAIIKIDLIHNPIPDINLPDSVLLCEGDEYEAHPSSSTPNVTFVWTLPDGSEYTGDTLLISQPGAYSVIAISEKGCESEVSTLTVSPPATPVITNIQVNGTTIVIGATNAGQGPLEYSLDGILWQSTNQFSDLIAGETYTVWIRSASCMIARQEVTILLIPNFISPNGDGKNDVWAVRGIQNFPGSTIKIFDRYGKIFVDTSFNNNYQWDGTYMGRNVASGDYWYIIHIPASSFTPEQKFSGHISVRNQ